MPFKKKKTKKKTKNKLFKNFIKDLDKLDKCRKKYCNKYGMSNESDACVKRKCSSKLSKLNKKYRIRKKKPCI